MGSRVPRRITVAPYAVPLALVWALDLISCSGVSYTYRAESPATPDLQSTVSVQDDTFILALKNATSSPVFLDWPSARFVDVAGFERPLRLLSEDNVGTPNIPLDPGAAITYQLEPAQYYAPPDRRWARRNSLRERITYDDAFAQAAGPRRVLLRVEYCAGAPCPAADACCAATPERQQLEVVLDVEEVRR